MVSRQEEGNTQQEGDGDHSNLLLEIVPMLLLETRWPPFPLRQYSGFWLSEAALQVSIPALHTFFRPRSSDVFLASVPKSGTTWLKALAFATVNRATHSPFAGDGDCCHPLHCRNPHDCIPFFEPVTRNRPHLLDELEALPSPRLLATHLPYSLLPSSVKGDQGSGSRIVYIARDPKDILVSMWIFIKKTAVALGVDAESFDFQTAFKLFCEGRSGCGPQWLHVLEYWNESVRRPNKVLFLRYEELLLNPKSNLKKLASFMGCEFSQQEEDGGVVDAIVELCSLDKLKNMEVNKHGRTRLNIKNESFFRKGVPGDWSNYMTPEMEQRLNNIVRDALQGSGFSFSN